MLWYRLQAAHPMWLLVCHPMQVEALPCINEAAAGKPGWNYQPVENLEYDPRDGDSCSSPEHTEVAP